MSKLTGYIVFGIIGLFCLSGVVLSAVYYDKYRKEKALIHVSPTKFIECSLVDHNFTKCNYTDEYCMQYIVIFKFNPSCKTNQTMVKQVFQFVPVQDSVDYCKNNHDCNYLCSDTYNTVNLYPPKYPDTTLEMILICFSALALVCALLVFFIWRTGISHPEYQQLQ